MSNYNIGYHDGYKEGYKDGESSLSNQYYDGYNEAEEKYSVYYKLSQQLLKFVSQKGLLDEFVAATDLTDAELSLIERTAA